MHLVKLSRFLSRQRSAVFGFTAAGLLCACLPCAAKVPLRAERVDRYEVIDSAEGARRLAAFRSLRLHGDFCFQFQLEQKPRRGKTIRYAGVMYGSWNERGPVSRFVLYPQPLGADVSEAQPPFELIVQNGAAPEVWLRRQAGAPFVRIDDRALFEPVFEGVLYTPFDLQMPFVFWQDYVYEGPGRVSTRIGQRFLMKPAAGTLADQHGITGVRIALDDAYYALLKAEVLGEGGALRSSFTAGRLKKIQGQWIVRQVSLKDAQTRDATDFVVKAASVGLVFDAALFDPQGGQPLPEIAPALFDVL
jgi:hypothetical protein